MKELDGYKSMVAGEKDRDNKKMYKERLRDLESMIKHVTRGRPIDTALEDELSDMYDEVKGVKEDATPGSTTSSVMASIAMPLFTGEKGVKHHVKARRAIDPMGHIFKGKKLKMKPYKMGYSNDTLAYRKKVKDIY